MAAKKNLHAEILKQMGLASTAKKPARKNPADPKKFHFPTAQSFSRGTIYKAHRNDDNLFQVTHENGVYIFRGYLNGKHFVESRRTIGEAKKLAMSIERGAQGLFKSNPLQPHKKGEALPLSNPETLPYVVQVKMATRWKTEAGFYDYDKAVAWGKKYAAEYPALHIRVATY